MRILTTTIEGFGPHAETLTIDWAGEDSVLALVAHNGAGKTFLIEADFACLYGDFPSYGGSIYDALTQNGTGTGTLTTTFSVNGATYRAERTVIDSGKTRRQTATLYEGDAAVAGPKVRDFDQAVATRFGHRSTALASWCSAQGATGDLVLLSPAERRGVFVELLGLSALDALAEQARDAAKDLDAQSHTLITLLAEDGDLKADRDTYQEQVSELQYELEKATTQAADLQKAADDALATFEEKQRLDTELRNAENQEAMLLQRYLDVSQEMGRLRRNLRGHRRTSRRYPSLVATWPALENAVPLEQRHAIAAARDQDLEVTQKAIAELVEQIRMFDWIRPSKKAQKAAQAHATYKADLETALAEERAQRNLRATQKAQRSALQEQLQAIKDQDLDTPADRAVCQTCVLYRQAENEQGRREALQADIDALTEALDTPSKAPDTEALRQRVFDAVEAQRKVAKWETVKGDRAKAARLLKNAKRTLKRLEAVEIEPLSETEQECLAAAQEQAANLRQNLLFALERLRNLKRDEQELATHDIRLALVAADKEEAERETQKARRALNEPYGIEHLETQANVAADAAKVAAAHKQKLTINVTEASLRLEHAETALRVHKTRKKKARTLAQEAKRLRALQKAFGRTGVQALIVDTALVGLQDTTNTLLATLSDERFQLEMATQSETRDGRMREDLAIRIYDGDTVREVGQFSGGEKRLFQIALRLGLTVWTNQAHGRAAGTLRIDEAFDALDDDRAHNVTELLASLTDTFGQIVVVTHNHNLAALLPGQVSL